MQSNILEGLQNLKENLSLFEKNILQIKNRQKVDILFSRKFMLSYVQVVDYYFLKNLKVCLTENEFLSLLESDQSLEKVFQTKTLSFFLLNQSDEKSTSRIKDEVMFEIFSTLWNYFKLFSNISVDSISYFLDDKESSVIDFRDSILNQTDILFSLDSNLSEIDSILLERKKTKEENLKKIDEMNFLLETNFEEFRQCLSFAIKVFITRQKTSTRFAKTQRDEEFLNKEFLRIVYVDSFLFKLLPTLLKIPRTLGQVSKHIKGQKERQESFLNFADETKNFKTLVTIIFEKYFP